MSDEELGELLGGGGLGEGDEMTGDIYIPSNSEGEDEGTLDESVFTTLVGVCLLGLRVVGVL